MGVQPIVHRRPDGFGYSRANVSDLELTLEQSEHTIGCQQAANSCHLTHVDRLIEQLSGGTVLRRAQNTNNFSPEALEVGQAGVSLRDAGAAKEDDIAKVTGDQQVVGDRRAVGYEAHAYASWL
jgi:hypothetical protein